MTTSPAFKLAELFTFSKVPNPIADDEIVIVGGLRTPTTKAKRGGLRAYKADQLLSTVLRGKYFYLLHEYS
jgi:hypothetical protein